MTVELKVGDKVHLIRGATSVYEGEFPKVVEDFLKFKEWSWEQVYIIKEFIDGDVGVYPEEGGKPGVVYVMRKYLKPVVESEGTSDHLVSVSKIKEAMGFFDMDWDDYEMDKIIRLANRLK